MSGYERLQLAMELTDKGVALSEASAIATDPNINSVDEAYELLGDLAKADAHAPAEIAA